MKFNDQFPTQDEIQHFRQKGYVNDDLLPKTKAARNMSAKNYFTLWMGSVHNIPNYAAVGPFLFLGLAPIHIILALVLAAMTVALFMTTNGVAGSKYGIPFSMHLRSTYGALGSKLPGFLRGCVTAIAWFGLQTFTGSQALMILIGKIWPGFLSLGGAVQILGIGVPAMISFALFWAINMLVGIGGAGVLNKFTAILSPLVYIVFIGMTVWAIQVAGGLSNILAFRADTTNTIPPILVYLMVINSVLAVWAAPGASVSDFTQNATSTKAQIRGQAGSLIVSYLVFAMSSVCVLIGASIHYGTSEWNVLAIIEKWDSLPAILLATLVLTLTTVSTNATGNIIPAGYQLAALFPKKISYKKGVWIAGIISVLIMPWKLMENADSIFVFLNFIGAMMGPVAGVMIAHFFFVQKQSIHLDELYFDVNNPGKTAYKGLNIAAYVATIVGLVFSVSGSLIPALADLARYAWMLGFGVAMVVYLICVRLMPTSKIPGAASNQ